MSFSTYSTWGQIAVTFITCSKWALDGSFLQYL
jgi:hypothetical protein